MKFVNLKLDKAEAKKEAPEIAEYEGPDYPWGLCLYLDEVALEKLGMTAKDFPVGEEMALMAMVKVTGISMREREGGESYSSVDLQLTEMALGASSEMAEEKDEEPKKKTVGGRLYGED